MYQPIDQVKTGIKLKMMMKTAGYDVKYIQEYLHLSCPQSIYRWFKGKVLPSVDHLCALSKLLNVHMEDLLVLQGESVTYCMIELLDNATAKRILAYTKYLKKIA
ncbi:MAG: helix-turn-helix domain-containing protein [Lachnospira sp.]